jgi:vacuolar-type H+-ATPase subunit I/STV1
MKTHLTLWVEQRLITEAKSKSINISKVVSDFLIDFLNMPEKDGSLYESGDDIKIKIAELQTILKDKERKLKEEYEKCGVRIFNNETKDFIKIPYERWLKERRLEHGIKD